MTDWLRKNLEEVFALPSAAVEWLLSLYRIIQVFDDIDFQRTVYDFFKGTTFGAREIGH